MASRPQPNYYTPLPKGLTPEEMNVIQYHRNNLDTGMYQTNPDGSPTTFYGMTMGDPGDVRILPRYWHGTVMEPKTAYRMAERSGIKFPSYPDADTALAREQLLHGVMEADSQMYAKTTKKK